MEIKYNQKIGRHEVYGPGSVTRNGEKQPLYVSVDKDKCRGFILRRAKIRREEARA